MTCGLIDLKFAGSTEVERAFSGHGAVFKNRDSYDDVIAPGAFAQWLADVKSGKQEWPAMLSQHGALGLTSEDLTPVGVWTDLAEDGVGLASEGALADTERGMDIYKLMKMKPRPAINGLSIGYIPREFIMGAKPNEPRRTLKRIDVREISPVTFPANTKARVGNVKAAGLTEREIERWLTQDAGLSRSEARVVINSGFKSLLAMQDAGEGESNELAQLAESLKKSTAKLAA